MKQFEIEFTDSEWREQMKKTVKSGINAQKLRISALFDYVFSLKLQKIGLNCWFKSRYLKNKVSFQKDYL